MLNDDDAGRVLTDGGTMERPRFTRQQRFDPTGDAVGDSSVVNNAPKGVHDLLKFNLVDEVEIVLSDGSSYSFTRSER